MVGGAGWCIMTERGRQVGMVRVGEGCWWVVKREEGKGWEGEG